MSWTRILVLLSALPFASCDALFPSAPNPDNCVLNPAICDISLGQICDLATKRCSGGGGACSAIAQCPMPTAVQCLSGACVPCDVDTQCKVWSTERKVDPALGYCYKPTGAAGGTCGRCSSNSHCTADASKAFCDKTSLTCRGCLAHTECDSVAGAGDGICQRPGDPPSGLAPLGQCVPAAMIGYLGNNTAGCQMNAAMASTPAAPYCTPTIARDSGKAIIKVQGSASPYPALVVTTQTVRFVGPGRDAAQTATFPSVDLNGAGTLVLSDVVVAASTTPAVQCRADGTLSLIASNLTNSAGQGIDAKDCKSLTVERTRISTPGRYAMEVGGTRATTYRIVNSLVIGSASSGAPHPVQLKFNASGVFNYNTITGSTGSVDCGNSFVLANSVFVKNGMAPNACDAATSVVEDSAMVLGAGTEPKLQNSQDAIRLCIDRGEQPAANDVQTDYFGNPRPKGQGWDKGYHELQ